LQTALFAGPFPASPISATTQGEILAGKGQKKVLAFLVKNLAVAYVKTGVHGAKEKILFRWASDRVEKLLTIR
jgi:hypothetical protein